MATLWKRMKKVTQKLLDPSGVRQPPAPLTDDQKRQKEISERQEEIVYLREQIKAFENYQDACDEFGAECPIVTKRGEEVLAILKNATLLEARAPKTQYRGSSHSMSIRIAKGVYYRPSVHSGNVSRGPDTPTVIDTGGTFTVTSLRAVYHGSAHNREWAWDKLIALNVERTGSGFYMQMPVSNRQRVSGIRVSGTLMGVDVVDWIHQRIRFALALHQGRSADFIQAMRNRLADLETETPPCDQPAGAVRGAQQSEPPQLPAR